MWLYFKENERVKRYLPYVLMLVLPTLMNWWFEGIEPNSVISMRYFKLILIAILLGLIHSYILYFIEIKWLSNLDEYFILGNKILYKIFSFFVFIVSVLVLFLFYFMVVMPNLIGLFSLGYEFPYVSYFMVAWFFSPWKSGFNA